jgi:hypothetical protein
VAFPQFVFPHTNYRPALGAEEVVDLPVAGFVALDLGFPECRPGLRPGGVSGAAFLFDGGLALGFRLRQLFRSGDFYTSTGCIKGLV